MAYFFIMRIPFRIATMVLPTFFQLLVTGGLTLTTTLYILSRLFPWLKYDLTFLRVMLRLAFTFKNYERKNMLTIDIFEDKVRKIPTKKLLFFEDKEYTYEFVNQQANKVANMCLSLGVKKKDVVALLIHNEPAFIWTHLGE